MEDGKKQHPTTQVGEDDRPIPHKKRELLDLGSSFARELSEDRVYRSGWRDDWRDLRATRLQPSKKYRRYLLEPHAYLAMSETFVTSKYCHTALNKSQMNKSRCPVTVARWTPEGRWLITGAQNGEFTLWNGYDFTFNRVIQGHDKAIKAMIWSRSGEWMVSGDHEGHIKVWNPSIAFMKEFKQSDKTTDRQGAHSETVPRAHAESVRGLTFSPTDAKLASCSDDLTVRIWDFGSQIQEELKIVAHDVRAIDWHSSKGLIVTGSRDQTCKLWSPREGRLIRTIPGHKQTVNVVSWHPTCEDVFLSASRDCTIRLHDLRMLREGAKDPCLQQWKAHDAEINAAAWHPTAPDILASGDHDGSLAFWLISGGFTEPSQQAIIPAAHEGAIWDLDWSPLGHMLASGSNDHTAKFWARPKPGDTKDDLYKGYNKERGLNEPLKILESGGSLPMSLAEQEKNRLSRTPDAVREAIAKSKIPGIGEIGEEYAQRQVGLLLAIPTDASVAFAEIALSEQRRAAAQMESTQMPTKEIEIPRRNAVAVSEDFNKQRPVRRIEDFPKPRYRGIVRRWESKGFGFISPFDPTLPSSGIFAHATSIAPKMGSNAGDGVDILSVGAIVEFSLENAENRKTKDMQCKAVDIIDQKYFLPEKFDGVDAPPSGNAATGTQTGSSAYNDNYGRTEYGRTADGYRGDYSAPPSSYHQPGGSSHPPPPPAWLTQEFLARVRQYIDVGQQAYIEEYLRGQGISLADVYPYLYSTSGT